MPCAHVFVLGALVEADPTFSPGEWNLVFASFVAAMFALLDGFAYFLSSRSELGARYRPIGTVSALVHSFAVLGDRFDRTGTAYVPSDSALRSPAPAPGRCASAGWRWRSS